MNEEIGELKKQEAYNIQESTPLEDFICLFTEPLRFFRALHQSEITIWVSVKAVLGMLSAVWLASINMPSMEETFRQAVANGAFDDLFQSLNAELPMVAAYLERFSAESVYGVFALLDQFVLLFAPASQFFQLSVLSLATFLAIKLFLRERKIHARKVFIAAVYSHWFLLWGAIPVGGILALFHPIYLYLTAISEMTKVDKLKSFLLSYLAKYVLMFILSFIFVFLVIFSVALMGASSGS